MPFPNHPFTLTGSCTCKAINYQISIPTLSSRPIHPILPNHTHLINLPLCTSTTPNTTPPSILLTPTAFVKISLTQHQKPLPTFLPLQELPSTPLPPQNPKPHFQPAPQVLASTKCRSLSFQPLNPGRTRISCSRCGTHLFITAPGKTPLLEIPFSTIKTEGMEEEWLVPGYSIYWDAGTLKQISVERVEQSFGFQKYHKEKSEVQVCVCEEVRV